MSTELIEVTRAVAEFDRVAAGIAELQSKYKGVVYDVATTKGMAEAKEARRAVREPRLDVERIRKTAKAPILALGKKLDSEAARITKELESLEGPIHLQITTEEARKETERQAKLAAEMKRVSDLQERVAELRGNRTLSSLSGSVLISDHIQDLEEIVVDDTFEEFRQQAEEAKSAGLSWLREIHAAALAHEVEQARIKAEREELARLRAEQARREADERARLAEEERKVAAAREAQEAELRRQREEIELQAAAERARIAEEERRAKAAQKAEADRQAEQIRLQRAEEARAAAERQAIIDAENARVRAEQDAAAQAERERLAIEERRLAEERAEIERQKAALAPPVVTLPPPPAIDFDDPQSASEIVAVLAAHFNVLPDTVLDWLAELDFSEVDIEEIAA